MTAALSAFVIETARTPLPEEVRHETERSLLNIVGSAVGAARSDAVEAIRRYVTAQGLTGDVPLLGSEITLPALWAAVATGTAAHYDDFDDTHLETVIHPSAACLGAMLAVGVPRKVTGARALAAFALGCEAQLRVGVAMSPSHYDAGWHITGTCGVLGAAVTAGVLMGLGPEGMEIALGVAASGTVGLREAFGTMTKPLHPGQAAANGLFAARLAASGLPGPTAVLESNGGYLEAMATAYDGPTIVSELGHRWELLSNSYKPYPCGIVSHPAIDAALRLRGRIAEPSHVRAVTIHGHPLVSELTGNPDPRDGLEAKFSTIHGVCSGLLDGHVGVAQYLTDHVRREELVTLRGAASLVSDPSMPRDAATVTVVLVDGTTVEEHVPHARGSVDQPLSDAELVAKARDLVEPVLPSRTDRIVRAVWSVADAPDLTELCRAATVDAGGRPG